jgi:hypothetical protein
MPAEIIREGDLVEILPAAAPPLGQPPVWRPHGIVVAVDRPLQRATVRVRDRHYPVEVPLRLLRRVT